jgi:hypothetical protein
MCRPLRPIFRRNGATMNADDLRYGVFLIVLDIHFASLLLVVLLKFMCYLIFKGRRQPSKYFPKGGMPA